MTDAIERPSVADFKPKRLSVLTTVSRLVDCCDDRSVERVGRKQLTRVSLGSWLVPVGCDTATNLSLLTADFSAPAGVVELLRALVIVIVLVDAAWIVVVHAVIANLAVQRRQVHAR